MSSRSFDASAEVARELGMKVGAVFQAKHRVIAQLRREIQILQGSPSDEVSSWPRVPPVRNSTDT